jgi:hypothetical protein
MQKVMRPAVLSAIGIAALLVTGTARAQAPNPQVGTWKGNIAKSTAAPGTALKANTTKIEVAGQGFHAIVDSEGMDGTKHHWEFTANYDGKDNPITGNGPYGDTVAVTRVDERTTRSVYKNKGVVTVTQTAAVSADGRTRTVTAKGKNVLGQTIDNVNVYDRQ